MKEGEGEEVKRIGSTHLLRGAAKGAYDKPAKLRVFSLTRRYALAPHSKRRGFHLESHELYDIWLFEPVRRLNRFEGCAVFPRHFDDSAYVTRIHSFASLADTSIASISRRLLYKSDLR